MSQPSVEARIRAAALRLFARRGFEATGIRDIASEAGVSSAALYHYMGTKEDLLVRMMTDGMQALDQACRKAIAPLSRPEERLATLVELHVLFHAHYQLWAVVSDQELRALSPEGRRRIMPLEDDYEALWVTVLTEGEHAGVFELPNPKLIRFALLGMCTAVARWYSPAGQLPAEDIATTYAGIALDMVGARRGRRRVRVQDLVLPELAGFADELRHVLEDTP